MGTYLLYKSDFYNSLHANTIKKTGHEYKKLAMQKKQKEGLLCGISVEPCNVVVCDIGRIS